MFRAAALQPPQFLLEWLQPQLLGIPKIRNKEMATYQYRHKLELLRPPLLLLQLHNALLLVVIRRLVCLLLIIHILSHHSLTRKVRNR